MNHTSKGMKEGTATCFAVQCKEGHIISEKYKFPEPREDGCIGFDWCGYCRIRTDIIPSK